MPKSKIPTIYTKGIVEGVAEIMGFSKKETTEIVDAVIQTISSNLIAGNKVNIGELFIASASIKPERKARNPRTGETIIKPPHWVVKFRPTKPLKTKIAQLPIK